MPDSSAPAGLGGSARFGRCEPAPRGPGRPPAPPHPALVGDSPEPPRQAELEEVFPLSFALADDPSDTLGSDHTSPETFGPPSPLLGQHSTGLARSLSSYSSLPNLRASRSRLADPSEHCRQPSPQPDSFDPSVLLPLAQPRRLTRHNTKNLTLQLAPTSDPPYSANEFPFPVSCSASPLGLSSLGDLHTDQPSPDHNSADPHPPSTASTYYSEYDQFSSNYEPDSPAYDPAPARARTRQPSQVKEPLRASHRRTQSEHYDNFDPQAPLGYTLNGKVRRPKGQPGRMFKCNGFGDCKMVFTRSEHLARHVRKHTGERPFRCHCGRTFSRLDNVRQHAATVHADQPDLNHQTLAGLVQLHNELSSTTIAKQAAAGMVIQDPAETAAAKAAKKRKTTGNLKERASADAEEAARMMGRGKFAVDRNPRARTQSAPVRVSQAQLGVSESPRYSPYAPSYANYQDNAHQSQAHYGSPLHQHAQIPASSHYQGSPVGSHSSPYAPGPSSVGPDRRATPLGTQHPTAGPSRYYGQQLTYGGQASPGVAPRDGHYAAQHQPHQLQHHYSNPNLNAHHPDLDDGSSDSQISPGGRVTLPSISRLLPSHSDPRLSESYYGGKDPAGSAQSGYGGELQHQQQLAMQQHHYAHQPQHYDGYARPPEAHGSPGPSNSSSFGDVETVPHSSWAGAGVGQYGQLPPPVSGAASSHLGYAHASQQQDSKAFALPTYPPVSQPSAHDSYSNQYNQLPATYGPSSTTPQGSPVRGYAAAGGGAGAQRESSERSSIAASASGGSWAGAQGGGLMEMVVGGGAGGGAGGGEGSMWSGASSGGSARYQLPPQAVGSA